ncbi:MAG: hypothetical protein ISR82_08395 [Candidatus Marinimicrobia bacterium]|nr:hypothetical protein [Candidatus Neomarinimicrobiota bacterium]
MKHETKTNIVSHNKNKIKKTALKEVGLKMGYQSEEKVLRTMSAFLKSKSMYDRLSSGHYDLKYIADQFVGKLCSILNLSPNLLKE